MYINYNNLYYIQIKWDIIRSFDELYIRGVRRLSVHFAQQLTHFGHRQSVLRSHLPTAQHYFVDLIRTALGFGQQFAAGHLLYDLVVGQLVPWLLPVGHDLPQHHSEAPAVALYGELPVNYWLGSHPSDRKQRLSAHLLVKGRSVVWIDAKWLTL